jgi:hypothetical protein
MHDPYVVAFEIKRPWPRGRIGRRRYWPALITVWHREPGGRDSGTVCRRSSWKRHVHHWRIQIRPLQHLRRWALTRCAWCGGKDRSGDRINISSSWDGTRTRWWRGEAGLRHYDCDRIWRAHGRCLCDVPALPPSEYGTCATCGGFRAFRTDVSEADRLLAALPNRSRLPAALRSRLEAIDAERGAAVRRGGDGV